MDAWIVQDGYNGCMDRIYQIIRFIGWMGKLDGSIKWLDGSVELMVVMNRYIPNVIKLFCNMSIFLLLVCMDA